MNNNESVFNIGKSFREAWGILFEKRRVFFPLTVFSLICTILYSVLSSPYFFLWPQTPIVQIVFSLLAVLFMLYFSIGTINLLLRAVRGKEVQLENFFDREIRFPDFFISWIGFQSIKFLALILPILFYVFFVSGNFWLIPTPLAFLGIVLFSIPVIITSLTFQFYNFIIVDTEKSWSQALDESRILTKGNRLNMLFLLLILGLLNVLGACFFYVGLVFTIPFSMLVWTLFYEHLRTVGRNPNKFASLYCVPLIVIENGDDTDIDTDTDADTDADSKE